MDIFEATENYESWMSRHIPVVKADLKFKHARMAESAFSFFRGTNYRWVQLANAMGLLKGPVVLGIGDLHVENFGTWRDIEGRLIWGVNDFDEAFPQPYFMDLTRLAASAHLATNEEHLQIHPRRASELIWQGYVRTLKAGGRPFVLEEKHSFLRDVALAELRDPEQFWNKMQQLPNSSGVPIQARRALKESMPAPDVPVQLKSRRAGVGSLGRQRFVAVADWRGGLVAREAKRILSSAYVWACGKPSTKDWISQILSNAVRAPDPVFCQKGVWIIRRLSPHCSRIELSSLPKGRDEERLLHAMGCETANIHLGSRKRIKQVLRDVDEQSFRLIHQTATTMVDATMRDWRIWRKKS